MRTHSSYGKPSHIAHLWSGFAVLVFMQLGPAVMAATVLQGPVLNPASNRTYYLLSPSSWTEAEATAVLLGGHLAGIGNQAEQDWVWNTFSLAGTGATGCLGLSGNRPDGLWIGLNDLVTEGTFVWSTPGEAVTYTNWGPDQPDNSGAGEDYVVMSGTIAGAWLDVTDTVAACRICGVIEVMPSLALAYYGDVEPEVNNSLVDIFGIGHGRFVLKQGTKVGGVVNDASAIDGKAYRLNDTIAGDGTSAVNTEIWASRNNSGGILNFIEASGSTVVARVRVVSFNEPGAMVGIDDRGANNRNAAKIGWSGAAPSTTITEFYRNQSANLAHDGSYHIYRLTSGIEEDGVRRVKCFFDENPTPVLVIDPAAATQTPSVSFDGWIFGTEGWQGTSDAYFDWVVGCDAGTVEPGQTHFLNDYIAQLLDPNAQRCGFSVVPMVTQTVTVSAGRDGGFQLLAHEHRADRHRLHRAGGGCQR